MRAVGGVLLVLVFALVAICGATGGMVGAFLILALLLHFYLRRRHDRDAV